MLKTRGGSRFEGYGNVKLATDHGTRAGWQLICYECQGLSDIIHRTGNSFPPKVLVRLFSEKGWKVGSSSASDVCPACMEKRRQRAKDERKQYAKGSVDRLLDMIRQVDLMLASSAVLDYGPYQPQIATQLKSLVETGYLCGMLTQAPDVPEFERLRARTRELEAALETAKTEYTELLADYAALQTDRDSQLAFENEHPIRWGLDEAWNLASEEARRKFCEIIGLAPNNPSPPPLTPKPSPPPSPPAQEGERISPRTAAFLAEVRKQVFKGATA